MHRFYKTLLALVAGLSLLTACAPPAAPATSTAASVATNAPATNVPATDAPDAIPTAAAYPVSIAHKYGSTELTQTPQRVVVVGLVEQDALLALGVVPVATREWYGARPGAIFTWALDELGSAPVPEVMAYELDFEKIAALRPDVIIGLYSGLTQEEYDTLSQIAPTVAQPAEYVDWGIPWQELTRQIGRIVGQAAQADALVTAIDAKFEAVRAAHPEFAQATAAMTSNYGYPESYYIYSSQDVRGRILTGLGFQTLPEVDELAGEEFGATVSRERLDLIDIDAVIWIGGLPVEARTDPVYQQLAVAQEGRDLLLGDSDPLYDALNFGTVLSLDYAIDELLPRLTAALDGDPATAANPVTPDYPVTIAHKFGEITLTEEPQRVVSLGYSEQDAILALGVQPVAVRDWFGDQPFGVWPWAQPALGDAEPELLVMPFGELDFEALKALQPDLIVATHSGITAEEYETLAQIAPTLAQPAEFVDFGVPWQEQTRLIGQALGKSDEAEALISGVEGQIAAAAEAHPEFAEATIVFASPVEGEGQYWVFSPNTPPLRFLTALGFSFPAELTEAVGDKDAVQISSEQVNLLDVDVLILQVGSEEERAAVENDPLFSQLAVVKEGRVVYFVGLESALYGSLSFSTVLSLPFAVDGLVPQLVAAVDGDPATVITP